MKPVIKKFRAPLYGTPVWVVVSTSIPKAIDYVEDIVDFKLHEEENRIGTDAYTVAFTSEKGKQIIFLFFKPSAKPGLIAHEVKHAINMLFSWRGVRLSVNNDEHECYYLETMIDKIHRILQQFKTKPKQVKINPGELLTLQ